VRPGLGVGGDSARIVVGRARDETRPQTLPQTGFAANLADLQAVIRIPRIPLAWHIGISWSSGHPWEPSRRSRGSQGGSRPICSLTRDRVEIKEREVNEKLEIETGMREVRQDPALAQCRGGSGGLRFPRIAGIVFA